MSINKASAFVALLVTAIGGAVAQNLVPAAWMKYVVYALGALHLVQSFLDKALKMNGSEQQGSPVASAAMKTGAAFVLAALLFAPQARAQAVAEPEPTNFVALGAAYNGASGNGWISYGKSLGAGFSSFTTYDVTIASRAPLVFQYSARTGVGFDFTTVAPSLSVGGHLHIIGLGDGGTAATAAALGTAFSGGGLASWDFGEKARHLNIVGGGRLLKTSTGGTGTVIEIGIALPF